MGLLEDLCGSDQFNAAVDIQHIDNKTLHILLNFVSTRRHHASIEVLMGVVGNPVNVERLWSALKPYLPAMLLGPQKTLNLANAALEIAAFMAGLPSYGNALSVPSTVQSNVLRVPPRQSNDPALAQTASVSGTAAAAAGMFVTAHVLRIQDAMTNRPELRTKAFTCL
jgi:hypothetical protein